jgi:hypothetical protein
VAQHVDPAQVIVPLGLCTFFQTFYGLQAVHIWTAIVIGHATRATLSVLRFRQGRWRSIEVDIGPSNQRGTLPPETVTAQEAAASPTDV